MATVGLLLFRPKSYAMGQRKKKNLLLFKFNSHGHTIKWILHTETLFCISLIIYLYIINTKQLNNILANVISFDVRFTKTQKYMLFIIFNREF